MTASRSLLLAALLATVAVPALAAPTAIKSSWNTGVMRAQNGAFSYCVSEAQYENGLWLILALNPAGEVNIGVGQKGVQLPEGGQRNSVLQVEGQTAMQIPAKVVKPELYVLNAGKNAALLQALASAPSVQIDGNSFSLSGSGQAVATLKECVQVSMSAPAAPVQDAAAASAQAAAPNDWVVPGQPQTAQTQTMPQVIFDGEAPAQTAQNTLPPSEPAPAQPVQDVLTPAEQAPAMMAQTPVIEEVAPVQQQASDAPPVIEAVSAPAEDVVTGAAPEAVNTPPAEAAPPSVRPLPASLNSLLAKAGVRDIAPAAPVGDGKFAWTSRTMKGQVREMTVAPGSDLVQLVEREMVRLKAACDTEFTSWPGSIPPSAGAMQVMTAQSRCRGDGRSDYSTHVFALTRGGVLSIISHETPGGTRAAADRAQAGLVKALQDIQG